MKRGTPDHPKIKALARLLKIPRTHAVGIMECLWQWTASYAPDGDLSKWTDGQIADAVEWADAESLMSALRHPDVRFIENDGLVHDWHEHCEDAVHTRLARAGKRFACGCSPNLSRVPLVERKRYGKRTACALHALSECSKAHKGAQKHAKPLPLPLPRPLPLPLKENGSSSEQRTAAASEAPKSDVEVPVELKGLELYERDTRLLVRWPKLIVAWKQACPGLDIGGQIARAHAWEIEHPKRRKVDKAAYLGRWLRREQDKGGFNGAAVSISQTGRQRIEGESPDKFAAAVVHTVSNSP